MEEKTKGIYKRNEGRWEARFRVGVNADGRARYRSVYAQTREEVIAKRQAAEAEILAAKTRKDQQSLTCSSSEPVHTAGMYMR